MKETTSRPPPGDRLPRAGGTLTEALALGSREVVALVGAGGKTTAMFRLARELQAKGAGVVVTTTTKILPPPAGPDLLAIVEGDEARLAPQVQAALGSGRVAVVARALTPEGKLDGIAEAWVAGLAALPGVTHVLVEADGAAQKPLKAPREGEPVIPSSATVVVPVVGADALGRPLSAEAVHRPERVAALVGLAPGQRIDAQAIATVLLDPRGSTWGKPATARVVPVVNKADSPERLTAAREIAAALRREGAERVVVAAAAGVPPVVELYQG
ncbi:MAG: putative selenium-dependent hydroxylase accessory protein YqeC [Chloroflexota bacterium]|nr:putative selenium-dependent hydroxylase accessory protein YqeC [Chloroflexota bacterium]